MHGQDADDPRILSRVVSIGGLYDGNSSIGLPSEVLSCTPIALRLLVSSFQCVLDGVSGRFSFKRRPSGKNIPNGQDAQWDIMPRIIKDNN